MKFVLLKRKILSLFLCLICAVTMFYIVSHPAVIGTAATTRQLPIYCVQRDQKMVSLSFDAAWGNVRMRNILITGGRSFKSCFPSPQLPPDKAGGTAETGKRACCKMHV